ncbi:MAG: hypothetical protein MUF87_08145 [Anaerolineae bacterium]|jgi:hypothetical protein|nr:hypothetical protein [Anaerolineae bacterium]
MPILLLAYGDPVAKDLLKKALEARYGLHPIALDALQVHFKGRARVKLGPVATSVPVDSTAYFQFPNAMRWDFTVKPLGLPIQRGIEALCDGEYRQGRGNKTPSIVTDEASINYLRRRLWAIAAILLTPLGEGFVKLSQNGPSSFNATNTQINDQVSVHLRPNYTIEAVQVECVNPETQRTQQFVMRLSEDLVEIDGILLPAKLAAYWDQEPAFEIEPINVVMNPVFERAVFTLESETPA